MAPRIFNFDITLRRVFRFEAAVAVCSAKGPPVCRWVEGKWRCGGSGYQNGTPLALTEH